MPYGITGLRTAKLLVYISASAMHAQPPCICMYMYTYNVQFSHTILSECNTLLFGCCSSRWLHNNQLTELPDSLSNATTQLQHL